MLTNNAKKQILKCLLETIEGISDKEYQKRVWIKGEGPEVDDFDETVCHFFQEGDGVIEKYKEFGLTEHQYQVLNKFRDQFQAFSDENDFPQEFIDSPEWKKIIAMAKEVLEAFDHKPIGIDKKYIFNEFLRSISRISDKGYQKRIWICAEGPEVDDFDETVCYFFGAGDSILENYKDFGITETQYQILKKFRDKFEIFSHKNDFSDEFIDSPNWEEIAKMAKEVLEAFNYLKT